MCASIFLCFRLAVKELLNQKKFSLFLAVNLALGLLSFFIIDSVGMSLSTYINDNSRNLATADITLSSRRAMVSDEKKIIDELVTDGKVGEVASTLSYFTMMESDNNTRLVRSQVFTGNYPLYGKLEVVDFKGNAVDWAVASERMRTSPVVAISSELQYLFSKKGIQAGDKIKLGDEEFEVGYLIKKDVEQGIGFRSFSHKVMVTSEQSVADLSEKGNSVRYRTFLKQPEQNNSLERVDASILSEKIATRFSSLELDRTAIGVQAHNQGGGTLGRVFGYVYRYLGLISLVTLFLSGIGAFYLYRTFIYRKLKDIAIMESLGMKKWQTFLESVCQLVLLGLASVVITLVLYFAMQKGIPLVLGDFLPSDIAINLSVKSIILIFIIALIGPMLFTLPLLLSIRAIQPIFLIKKFELKVSRRIYIIGFLPAFVAFYGLAVWISGSFFQGNIFTLTFGLAGLLIFFLGVVYWQVLNFTLKRKGKKPGSSNSKRKKSRSFLVNMVLKNLSRNRSVSFFYFFSVAIAVLLISLVPQMEYSIRSEFQQPTSFVPPSLFLFNIQANELAKLKSEIETEKQSLDFITPFISAQLVKKNGKDINFNSVSQDDQPSMEEQRKRARLRRINLTYRGKLTPSESLVDGLPFSDVEKEKSRDEVVELSVEKRYAQQMGFQIDDTLTFKLIEVPFQFTGKIVNFREVKWNSFQPNFFINVVPGLLNQVPHQYVASVSGVRGRVKDELQTKIFKQHPNISVIDILAVVEQVLNLVSKMVVILKVMALFCFVLGMFILFTIVNHEVLQRKKEINLLKSLGAKFYQVYFMVVGEHLLLGVLAILTGFFPSVILNYLFGLYFFQGAFSFSFSLVIQIFVVMVMVVLAISYLGSGRALKSKPISLLKTD